MPPDNTAIEKLVTTAMTEMKEIPPDAPQQQKDIIQTLTATFEPLKQVEAAALSGGLTGNGLQLVASANFTDTAASKGFADNYNKLMAAFSKLPEMAQFFLAAQGMGVMLPSAESKEKQASLTLAIPMNAIQSLGGMIGGMSGGGEEAHYSQATVQRWTMLSQTVGNNQWPHATIIQKNLGKANEEKKKCHNEP